MDPEHELLARLAAAARDEPLWALPVSERLILADRTEVLRELKHERGTYTVGVPRPGVLVLALADLAPETWSFGGLHRPSPRDPGVALFSGRWRDVTREDVQRVWARPAVAERGGARVVVEPVMQRPAVLFDADESCIEYLGIARGRVVGLAMGTADALVGPSGLDVGEQLAIAEQLCGCVAGSRITIADRVVDVRAIGVLPVPTERLRLELAWIEIGESRVTEVAVAGREMRVLAAGSAETEAWIVRVPDATPASWQPMSFEASCVLIDASVSIPDDASKRGEGAVDLVRAASGATLLFADGPDLITAVGWAGFDAAGRLAAIVVRGA